MNGPYLLNKDKIDEVVTETSAGNYALGYVNEKGTFIVKYVGRADSDVNASPKAAFEKECRNYHDFGGSKSLDNKIHPDRPKNSSWKCPCCDTFD